MSSVGLPRSESAAARLMAVVVFPTPPFWFAMATIIGRCGIVYQWGIEGPDLKVSGLVGDGEPGKRPDRTLHLVLPHLVRVEALEPLLEPLGVPFFRGEID